ncbi:unannotated protein [freshwater metagenome]|uniref:Unannotated protein n=1 Tax=freshwater metagenome TaxID=449393 RepID=A0A6J6F7V5_9ZZZZ
MGSSKIRVSAPENKILANSILLLCPPDNALSCWSNRLLGTPRDEAIASASAAAA